ncbi:MAG: acriflavin resistance protein [Planctomycetota bacterium]|nr:MAG: acriflavin resistance protein [Planctomycetota bacterium]
MFLPEVSIRRPVFAVMLTAALLVFGYVGYSRLPVRELPDIEFPIVTVSALLPGASPEVVEKEVTDPIEEAIGTIEGIKTLESVSSEGGAQITITFELERDIDVAAQEVRDRIASIRQQLPEEIEEPVVAKLDLDAQAIMWIALTATDKSRVELTEYADKVLKPRLEGLSGIGQILIGGAQEFAVRVWLDPQQLAARQLTVADVARALREQNAEIPSGRIESLNREFTVRTEGELPSVVAFEDLIVAWRGGAPVRLREVARVEPGPRQERQLARFSRRPDAIARPAVGLGILKQSEANTVAVARRVKAELERIRQELPPGYEVTVAFDSSTYIEQSIAEVEEALVLGGGLAAFVILMFLVSWRSTVIAGLAIPTSIVATFAVIYFLGFTINTLTLLALTISVGVVIDDAIVVLENIYRHAEEGKPLLQAAREGAAEIAFAAMAATFAIVAVFLPVAFVEGMVGRLFFEFAVTVAVAVLISLAVALTLTPMLCSRFLRPATGQGWLGRRVEAAHQWLTRGYGRALAAALRHRWLVVGVALAATGGGFWMFSRLGKELSPETDQGSFIIFLRAPQGATVAYTDRYLAEIEQVLAETPEVRTFFAAIGLARGGPGKVHEGICFVRLRPYEERRAQGLRGQFAVMAELRRRLAGIPGLLAFVQPRPTIATTQRQAPLQYVLMGPELEQLYETGEALKERLRQVPGIVDVNSDLDLNKPQLAIRIRRDKAAESGISVAQIAEALRLLLGGDAVTDFERGGERYDVMVQLAAGARQAPAQIEELHLRAVGPDGRVLGLVPLANLLEVVETVGPSEIYRFGRRRANKIEANLEGVPLAQALEQLERIGEQLLPAELETAVTGQTEEMQESFRSLGLALLLAVLIIYMVLASQFNHFVHPFTIMLALPLSAIGAFGALYAFGMTVNLFSFIGFIVLMGLVTKNSILLVDYTNQLREAGEERERAVVRAGEVRLRPILMTAISMIFGVLPAALGLGAGAESRRPMAVATAGGMLASTLLTLFVVPVAYVLLDEVGRALGRLVRRRPAGAPLPPVRPAAAAASAERAAAAAAERSLAARHAPRAGARGRSADPDTARG